MRIKYKGSGSVRIERVGTVKSGESIDVPKEIGEALIAQDSTQWTDDKAPPRTRATRGGGD